MELLTNPITYIVGFIILALALEFRKNGFKNSSPKSSEPNKTSYTKKPTYASSGLPKQKKTPTRARTSKGKFVADDPTTPQNEAWEGGKAPKKTATKKTAKKKVAKKKVAKKTTTKKSPTKN
jgi:hypothetical protein